MSMLDLTAITALLKKLHVAVTELLALLNQENECLIAGIPKDLGNIIAKKQEQLSIIEQLQQLLTTLTQTDPSKLNHAISHLMNELPASDSIAIKSLWKSTVKLLDDSRHLNIINGGLAHQKLWKTRQMLDVLLPDSTRVDTYDNSGNIK